MNLEDFKSCVKITRTEYPTGAIILHGEFNFLGRNVITVDEQRPPGDAERELVEKMWKSLFGDIYERLERLELR